MNTKLIRGLGAFALMATWSCSSLDVKNPNEPDANRALKNPSAMQALTAGAFQTWFNAYNDLRGAGVLSTQARTLSSSWNNGNLNYHQGIYLADASRMNPADTTVDPLSWTRNGGAYDNNPSAAARTTIDAFWGGGLDETSTPRPGFYASLASANTVLNAIRNNNLVIGDAANTKMVETAAAFMQGASLMVIALQYDKAYIVDENSTPKTAAEVAALQYSTRDIVRDSAVSKLLQAAALANANSFATPDGWTDGAESFSNTDIAKIAYTMAAMTLAYYPRDSTEAAAVDWATVEQYASQGISTGGKEWHATGDGGASWIDELMGWFDSMDSGRVHTRVAHFVDPATQLDPYPLGIGSPQPNSVDARMGDGTFASSNLGDSYNNIPKDAGAGTDFAWLATGEIFRSDRGYYVQSNIGHMRYDASGEQATTDVYYEYGNMPAISSQQNDLLWAEARMRQGNYAGAATLIDKTRVGRGHLPSALALVANPGQPGDGPCETDNPLTPARGDQVLAKDGTACTLWSALLYENEIELLGLGPAPYWNQRHMPNVVATAWERATGCRTNPCQVNPNTIFNGPRYIQGLLPGTPREMPVPYKELGVKGEALYTWGGSTNPANSPTP